MEETEIERAENDKNRERGKQRGEETGNKRMGSGGKEWRKKRMKGKMNGGNRMKGKNQNGKN